MTWPSRLRKGVLYVGVIVLAVISARWLGLQFDKSELYAALPSEVLAERLRDEPLWEGRSDWQMCRSLGRPDAVVLAEHYDVFFFNPPRAYVKVYIYDAINLAAYIDETGTVVVTDAPVRKYAQTTATEPR